MSKLKKTRICATLTGRLDSSYPSPVSQSCLLYCITQINSSNSILTTSLSILLPPRNGKRCFLIPLRKEPETSLHKILAGRNLVSSDAAAIHVQHQVFLFLYQRALFMYQIILSFLFLIVQMALFMYPKMILNVFILVPEGTFYVSNDTLYYFCT